RTMLERTVPAHFGVRRPWSVLEGIREGVIARERVVLELPPLVFDAAARGDAVARGIVDALADEVVTMVVASLRRLRLLRAEVDVTPRDRDVAMVFQNYALYPHMTVAENLSIGLRLRRRPKSEVKARVGEVAHILGLDSLLERRPAELSGGQRQRVAMGRAMVRE